MTHNFLKIVRILAILGLLAVPGSSLSFAQNQGVIGGPPSQDSSGLVVVKTSTRGTCGNLDLIIGDSTSDREGTYICAGHPDSEDSSVYDGEGVIASMTVRNTSNHSIVIKELKAGGRGPNAHAKNWDARNVDWPADKNFTLQPGQEHKYYQMQYFTGNLGDYFAEPVFQDGSGQWHGIGPYPRVWFNVVGGSPPKPGAIPTIQITGISWLTSPTAYVPATLRITGKTTGMPAGSGYMVNILVHMGLLKQPLNFWYDPADAEAAPYITPQKLPSGNFEIRVSGISLPRLVNAQLAVQVFSTTDQRALDARPNETVSVGSSDQQYKACFSALSTVGLSVLKAPEGLTDAKRFASLTIKTFTAQERAERCHGNQECINQTNEAWLIDVGLSEVDGAFSKSLLGYYAVVAKNTLVALPDIYGCREWYKEQDAKLSKKIFNAAWNAGKEIGKRISSVVVNVTRRSLTLNSTRGAAEFLAMEQSPVYPLIVDSSGKRAGFLADGTPIQEIPDSVAVELDGQLVVVAPSGDTTVRLSGYGQGVMSVYTFLSSAAGDGNAVSMEHDNVPVSQGMIATINSSDTQGSLNIDNNGDGRVDQSRAPDAIERVNAGGGASPDGSYSFPQTGFAVSGRLWQIWQSGRSFEDSLYINGYPITTLRSELSTTDGKTYQTQWFERARFEQHPENQAPYDVLLGLLGANAAKGRQNETPFKPVGNPGGGVSWFKETSHTLGDSSEGGRAIASYWNNLGGLQQFGFPLSQPFTERNKDDSKTYLVQYFERQRFEYHPENKGTRYEVLLGRLGAEQKDKKRTPLAVEQEQLITDRINEYRRNHGLPPFLVNNTLVRSARHNAEWLQSNDRECKNGLHAPDLVQFIQSNGYPNLNNVYVQDSCNYPNDAAEIFGRWLAEPGFHETYELVDHDSIGCGWWPQSAQSPDDHVWVTCLISRTVH